MMTYNMVVVNKETGEPRVSTLDIALGTEIQHKNVMELVRNYQDVLEEFGRIAFETRLAATPQGGGKRTQYAMLNERQATLIISFMRNSEVVVDFKLRLVKEFYRMKDYIQKQQQQQPVIAPQNKLQILSQALMIAHDEWKPKADTYDHFMDSSKLTGLTEAAKVFGLKPRKFIEKLRMEGTLGKMQQGGVYKNLPLQRIVDEGYMTTKLITPATGFTSAVLQTFFTPKGMDWLSKRVRKGEFKSIENRYTEYEMIEEAAVAY